MKGNIALFDEYAAKILATLYESFPVPVFLNAMDIAEDKEIDEFGVPLNANGQRSKHFDVALSTIEWLSQTGFIYTNDRAQYGYDRCVLTANGLEILQSAPESIQGKTPLGEKIITAIRTGALSIAIDASKTALKLGANILLEMK